MVTGPPGTVVVEAQTKVVTALVEAEDESSTVNAKRAVCQGAVRVQRSKSAYTAAGWPAHSAP